MCSSDLATGGSRQVVAWLAQGGGAVMAVSTTGGDTGVVQQQRALEAGSRIVAGVTL